MSYTTVTTANLVIGDTLSVHVVGNASTGYAWTILDQPECLEDLGTTSAAHSNLVGASSSITFRWLATSSCTNNVLRLRYGRDWDNTTWTFTDIVVDVAPRIEPKNVDVFVSSSATQGAPTLSPTMREIQLQPVWNMRAVDFL